MALQRQALSSRLGLACTLLAALSALILSAQTPVLAQETEPIDCSTVADKPQFGHAGALAPDWVEDRQKKQLEQAKEYRVFHDFRFTDRVTESGITFKHEVVDDAGKTYKAVHYDHGTGLAVADVDGDGRYDLYYPNQIGSNELWRNVGGGKFEQIVDAGAEVADRISVAASFGDTDNDGDPDLFVTTVRGGNLLFTNDGKGKFTDVTKSAGLGHVGHSSGAIFFDYDNDGLLDLFVTNVGKYTTEKQGAGGYWIGYDTDAFQGHLNADRTEYSILYRNLGNNRFEDVSAKTGLRDASWSGDASPIDLNEDGWHDLYVLNMQGHDQYWENQGGTFVNKSREIFPKTPWGAMGISVFDYNNDGRMDIYLTDMHTDMTEVLEPTNEKSQEMTLWPNELLATDGKHVLGNALFLNQGKGRFFEMSALTNAENFWPWGLSSGDLNADGWDDVFITASMNYPWRYGINSLLLNDKGLRFLDSEYVLGAEPRRGGATAKPWFDLDCSGADRAHNECKHRTGCITVMGALGTRSSALFDIDADGDVDIVTAEFHAEPMVLVSNLSEVRDVNYLEVRPVGTQSNRSGFGARITVKAGDKTWVKVHDGKSGYLSQSDLPVYFGLGDATKIDSVEVQWPSGQKQKVSGPITIDSTLKVVEPKAATGGDR